ncbi:MAG: hypothetical protein ACI3VD_08085 [Candidatus Limivicinus sp.]
MFAASTYEEIVEYERQIENSEIVVFLFVRPTNQSAIDIIREFEYIHYNSYRYCSIFAIGYTENPEKQFEKSYEKIAKIKNIDWYFSTLAFVDFKNKLERRINWKYSGESEVLILQNNPGNDDPLNFKNYVAIDINKGLREGYIDSFQAFMESLIRSAKSKVTAKEALSDIRRSRLSIKDTIAEAIGDCKKIPTPVKDILKDRLFYRCANNFLNV